eukprot:scaffold11760_cov1641-Chaetoceros_neogracile.AAC.1
MVEEQLPPDPHILKAMKPPPALDTTSPGYLMANMLNTIAHSIIQNKTNRCNQTGELTFFLAQLKLQKYGQIHVRTTMATLLADLCGCDSISLEDWDYKHWDAVIMDFSQLYHALIRKDARHCFVPKLLKKLKNSQVDIKVKNENLLDKKNDEGLEEESVLPDSISVNYMDYIHASFTDCTTVKKALVSLVSLKEGNGDTTRQLYIKKPSELNIHLTNTSFRQYYNLQNLQDRFDYVVSGWESIVLPLPTVQTIGKYTIPEVLFAEKYEESNESVGDVDYGYENDGTEDEEDNDDEDSNDKGC